MTQNSVFVGLQELNVKLILSSSQVEELKVQLSFQFVPYFVNEKSSKCYVVAVFYSCLVQLSLFGFARFWTSFSVYRFWCLCDVFNDNILTIQVAFKTGDYRQQVIFIGGLTDGFLATEYVINVFVTFMMCHFVFHLSSLVDFGVNRFILCIFPLRNVLFTIHCHFQKIIKFSVLNCWMLKASYYYLIFLF